MCDSSRSSSPSPNRPQSWSAMQRILHSYLGSACHAFQDRERWIVSGVRKLQSHLCTQEHYSSHSFQWSPTFTRTHFKETSYSRLSFCATDQKGSVVWGKRLERLFESLHYLFVFLHARFKCYFLEMHLLQQRFSCAQPHFCLYSSGIPSI